MTNCMQFKLNRHLVSELLNHPLGFVVLDPYGKKCKLERAVS